MWERSDKMKFEKREITLNEFDSLKDAYYREKVLMEEYVNALFEMDKKQSKDEILKLICETAEEIFLLKDLMKAAVNKKGI